MSVPVLFLTAALASAAVTVQQPAAGPTVPPAAVVVEGCVVTAREVNGKATDVGEKLGLNEHFVLASPRMVKGKAPAGSAPALYDIDGLSDEQLKVHVGRRVRIDGSFAPLDPAAASGDADERPELTARTIRQVPGDCTAVPKS